MAAQQASTLKKLDLEVEKLQGELMTIEGACPSNVASNQ
jgi:hypothetical protein